MTKKNNEKINDQLNLPHITLKWLFQNVPVRFWVSSVSILIGVFGTGAMVGQTSFVRELIGKSQPQSILLSAENVSERIDKLTEGYNSNVAQLTAAIVKEEADASKTVYSSEQAPHLDAAKRLRETLKDTREAYNRAIQSLREFKSNKSAL